MSDCRYCFFSLVAGWIKSVGEMRDLIAIAAILFSAYVVRKTALESRGAFAHQEMCRSLPKTLEVLERLLTLLDHVSRHVLYNELPERRITGNAYDQYWQEIGKLSAEYKKIAESNRLFFPAELYADLRKLLAQLNRCKDLAVDLKPDERGIYPDTSGLLKVVEGAGELFREFVAKARRYIGTDKLNEISELQPAEVDSEHKNSKGN